MNVRSLTLQLSRGGLTDGILAFNVGLSSDSPALSASSLIDKIVSHKAGSVKYTIISGDIAAEDPEIMNAFTKSLKDFGFATVVETNGLIYPSWFQHTTSIRVILRPDSIWLRHAATEIHLYIQSGNDPEPALPPNKCPMYVIAPDIKQAVSFVKSSDNHWGIIEAGRKSAYSEVIYVGVQDSGIALRIKDEAPRK